MNGDAMVAAARGCVGARFRLQGRDPATGLDCLGVVLIALAAGGCVVVAPRDYALSGNSLVDRLEAGLRAAGCGPAPCCQAGDVILFEPAPGQAHLGVASLRGVIHAHLGVGSVVESPPDPTWLWRSIWRYGEAI